MEHSFVESADFLENQDHYFETLKHIKRDAIIQAGEEHRSRGQSHTQNAGQKRKGKLNTNRKNKKQSNDRKRSAIQKEKTKKHRVQTREENNSAMNLTNYTVASKMRSTHDSSTVAGTFTCTISDATAGEITMQMTNSTTANIEEGIYVYDVEITNSAGTVTRILEGQITVNPEVTR